ncbi:hypothetical protein BofuT4_P158440.1 [Botrytis cinerea T4]|uniref:DUF7587 domain-containing protein n=1 Tax=Botryotinia fuckeliana (strain T4) TaxID=999810 RepID=G2YV00_BOTF4|nr:hypothetical protein BofuT4_P158440.1 [Botrytis cinerea T4]
MSSRLFYRAYSPNSAGDIVCGKSKTGLRPSHIDVTREFDKHRDIENRIPTALVSVTSSIVRAIKTAFNKHYKDGENRVGIWIVFIRVPYQDADAYHSARKIAERFHGINPLWFKDEYLFEWEIPMKYVVHRVSVGTLVDRGLDMKEYCEEIWDRELDRRVSILPRTAILRNRIANTVCDVSYGHHLFESHVYLAEMARAFGARVFCLNIPWEIFADCCVHSYSCPTDFVQRYDAMQEDCNIVLLDWWLIGDVFNDEYESHLEYADELQEIMKSQWVELSGNMNDTSEDSAWFKEEYEKLMERNEEIEAEIEANAVRIGL